MRGILHPKLSVYARHCCAGVFGWIFLLAILGSRMPVWAEGTLQLEPRGADPKSYCKLVLFDSKAEYRIPFALFHCSPEYRLNIRIHDHYSEKIYLAFGDVIDYVSDTILYHDVKYLVRDPNGNIVAGDSTLPLPKNGEGYIENRSQAENGPQVGLSNPGGYKPIVISPQMDGDYYIEFKVPAQKQLEIRTFKYFDISVVKSGSPVTGRLWSKAWQLSSGSVSSAVNSSYSRFFIYTNDSIVTRFDCNGMAGGVWNIYSNEWGCATSGSWNDRRHSTRGNASMLPQYKIFLNDPDPDVFPSGHIGRLDEFKVLNTDCDTVVKFGASVSKAGNVEVFIDVPPLNAAAVGPEDVKLIYPVEPGENILLPAWDGKDGRGRIVENGTLITTSMRFMNGLTNLPLYDVEDNPNGFKVDIQRPLPASGYTKLGLFWDDTYLPNSTSSSSNITEGCIYSGTGIHSGCHAWNYVKYHSLGDTNTINTWWYLTTESSQSIPISLKIRPSAGNISGPDMVCSGRDIDFQTIAINYAKQYVWDITGPGFSSQIIRNAPDNTLQQFFATTMPTGDYTLTVFGRNPQCRDGEKFTHKAFVYDYIAPPVTGATTACRNTTQQYQLQGSFSKVEWIVKNGELIPSTDPNTISIRWHTSGPDTVKVYATTAECGRRPSILPVYIHPDAIGAFSTPNGNSRCPGMPVDFVDHSQLESGRIITRHWDLGNGASVSDDTVLAYPYLAAGNFSVKLTVTTDHGCETETISQVRIIPFPVASFSVYRNCLSEEVTFTDNSTGHDLALWKWDFGSAPVADPVSVDRQPEVVFSALGRYPVKLVVGNQYGCYDSITQQVEIHQLPHAGFKYENPCRATGIAFNDLSSEADASFVDYSWYVQYGIGPPTVCRGDPAVIVFDYEGPYTVKHIVTDIFGCTDSISKVIVVKPRPDAAFEYTAYTGPADATLQLHNFTSGADSYFWDFGNGITSGMAEPLVTYTSEGLYTLSLLVKNTENCYDTAVSQYYYMPGFWMPNAFSPNHDNFNDVFKPVTQRTSLNPYSFSVYNRWGQQLFSTTNPSEGWDGTYQGKDCEAGTYTYLVEYPQDKNGAEMVQRRGVVKLVR